MCTCNGEAYLKEQLDSFLAQTLLPDELIVCDDASTDNTVGILESFRKTAPFPVTIFVNENRLRVCKNFEKAVENCSGDIIVLSDQDDIWLPAKIATLTEAFEKNPGCGYVFSNADLINEQGQPIGQDLWKNIGFDRRKQARYSAGDQISVMLQWFTLAYGMTMAFRAAFKSQLRPFECRFFLAGVHDTWISLYLTAIGAYGVAVPCSLVKYRQHPKQLASGGQPLGVIDLVKARRSEMSASYESQADLLTEMACRVQHLEAQNAAVADHTRKLTEKAMHLRARVRANSSRGFERIKIVFLEALSGRYSDYSRSFKSIVKDLVSE